MLLTSNEPLRKSKEDINKILRDKKKMKTQRSQINGIQQK